MSQERGELGTQILTTAIRSQDLDLLVELILHFVLKLFELVKGFRFMSHQEDITVSTEIISERDEVRVSTSGICA